MSVEPATLTPQTEQTQPAPAAAVEENVADSKPDADAAAAEPSATPAIADENKEKGPNPLKKLLSTFKSLFKCLRKPSMKELGEQEKEPVGEEAGKAVEEREQGQVDGAEAGVEGAGEENEVKNQDGITTTVTAVN